MKVIKYINKSDPGSAIAEFLIFTLPFFTAFLILITAIQNRSMAISESKNLARQSVRAFVSSPNEELARVRAYQVVEIYKSKQSRTARSLREIELDLTCSSYPCFTPGNLVTATIKVGNDQVAVASEYVDLWR
ncbi:hypothetical protein B1s21122_01485 [Candidatus Nanopelagicus limnes]|uniref:TadE-like protein n=2 Tax=Candidatus Nanopelagicus limnae TaxID=1884634 RepID=A0A249JWY1_9ACTN|nr:hypothetical protein B1s21122_01485 [Candidatus Nanopelagicus limnes]